MSRKKLGSRQKVVQKMSRDGLVERNQTTGGEKRVSMRDAEFNLRESPQDQEGYSQSGNIPLNREKTDTPKIKPGNKAIYRRYAQNAARAEHDGTGPRVDTPMEQTPPDATPQTIREIPPPVTPAPSAEPTSSSPHRHAPERGGKLLTQEPERLRHDDFGSSVANLIRWASPPESVVEDCPRER